MRKPISEDLGIRVLNYLLSRFRRAWVFPSPEDGAKLTLTDMIVMEKWQGYRRGIDARLRSKRPEYVFTISKMLLLEERSPKSGSNSPKRWKSWKSPGIVQPGNQQRLDPIDVLSPSPEDPQVIHFQPCVLGSASKKPPQTDRCITPPKKSLRRSPIYSPARHQSLRQTKLRRTQAYQRCE